MYSSRNVNSVDSDTTLGVSSTRKVSFLSKLLVGGTSGVLATSIVYPMDIVKTTMQRQVAGQSMLYKNPLQAFKGIVNLEGARGLYRGMGANLIGVFPVQALKLASNDLFRDLLADENGNVSFISSIMAGAGAGCVQVIASNPMEITKIRLQIQSSLPPKEQKNIVGVVRELGFKGLYKGSTITLMRDIPYFMIFFPLNHYLVELFTPSSGVCGLGGLLLAGCGAGMTSAFLMTPMDVIKTRVQAAKGTSMSSSFPKMFLSTLKSEGVTALFKGASMRMAVQAPMFAIMTTAFELQKRFLASR